MTLMAMNTEVPSWVRLTEGEQIVWSGRRSLWAFMLQLVIGSLVVVSGFFGLMFTGTYLQLLSLGLIVVGLLLYLSTTVNYLSVYYVLTNEEVYKKTGLLSRHVTNLRLDRIQNTSYGQSFLERLLSYGTIRIHTAGTGGTEIILHDVTNPEAVNGHLTEQLDELSVQPGAFPPE